METLQQTATHQDFTQIQESSSSWLEKLEESSEFNRYGITSMLFMLIGIFGGVAIGMSAFAHLWQMAIIAVFTMTSLSLMLAVAPMKWVLRATALALVVDVLLVVINAIA